MGNIDIRSESPHRADLEGLMLSEQQLDCAINPQTITKISHAQCNTRLVSSESHLDNSIHRLLGAVLRRIAVQNGLLDLVLLIYGVTTGATAARYVKA